MINVPSIDIYDAIRAGYVGNDCYVTYEVNGPDGTVCGQAQFHVDTDVNGWFGTTFFRQDVIGTSSRIKTELQGFGGYVAVLVPSETPWNN